jgi:hypothetical protein
MPVEVELMIVAPEPTAIPVPTAMPAPVTTPDPVPAKLAKVISQYGIDPARRFIVVDTATQQMVVWEPGQPAREMPISTGDESRGYRTPAWYGLVGKYVGTFYSHGVYADEGWYLFEDAGNILVHGAPYKLLDGSVVGTRGAAAIASRLHPLRPEGIWFTDWDRRVYRW